MKIRRFIIILAVISFIFSIWLYVYAADYSRNASFDEAKRDDLFVDAYAVMMEQLSELRSLTYFNAVMLEFPGDLQNLAKKLDEIYEYSVSVSDTCGNYDDNRIAYVYLIDYGRTYNGFNKVKIVGSIFKNKNYVEMYYTYRNKTWVLVKAEVFQS